MTKKEMLQKISRIITKVKMLDKNKQIEFKEILFEILKAHKIHKFHISSLANKDEIFIYMMCNIVAWEVVK